jgi:hypothetical protein
LASLSPSITTPSAGTVSPGLTRITSPGWSWETGTRSPSPAGQAARRSAKAGSALPSSSTPRTAFWRASIST